MFVHSNDAVFTVATTGCVAMVTNRHPATRACSTTNNTFIKYHILHKVPFIKYKKSEKKLARGFLVLII